MKRVRSEKYLRIRITEKKLAERNQRVREVDKDVGNFKMLLIEKGNNGDRADMGKGRPFSLCVLRL